MDALCALAEHSREFLRTSRYTFSGRNPSCYQVIYRVHPCIDRQHPSVRFAHVGHADLALFIHSTFLESVSPFQTPAS